MTEKPKPAGNEIPALFATIHFRSEKRPDGYTAEEIAELNELANAKEPASEPDDEGPA